MFDTDLSDVSYTLAKRKVLNTLHFLIEYVENDSLGFVRASDYAHNLKYFDKYLGIVIQGKKEEE